MHFGGTPQPRMALLLVSFAFIGIAGPSQAAGTAAGTVITNTATVNYNNVDSTTMPAVTSPAAVVNVIAKAGVKANPPKQSGNIPAGQTIYFPVTVDNTANTSDTLDLTATSARGWTVKLVRDDNGNGYHEPSEITAVTNTGSLAADAQYRFFVALTVPSGATGNPDSVTLKVTSRLDSTTSTSVIATAALAPAPKALAPAWVCSLGSAIYSSPTIADGIAYVGTDDGHLYAVRATGTGAGSILWQFPAGAGVGAPIRGRPSYYGGVLYFGANNGYVYAVNPDGSQRWAKQISPAGTAIEGAPAVVGTTLYIGTGDRYIYALRTTDGAILGRSLLLASAPSCSVAVPMGNFVWFGSQDGSIQSLSPDLGTMRWQQAVGTGTNAFFCITVGSRLQPGLRAKP